MRGDLGELRAGLRASCEALAFQLWGEPTAAQSSRQQLRWGGRGSRALELRGSKRGLWHSFEDGAGGDMLAGIRERYGLDFPAAIGWAREWLGQPLPEQRRWTAAVPKTQSAEIGQAQARTIAKAERLIADSGPLGELGRRYLVKVRGIPEPPQGWPDCIRWNARERAIIGIVGPNFVHAVYLTQTGEKLTDQAELRRRRIPGTKTTWGPKRGRVLRIPAREPTGKEPVVAAEGLETALMVASATGFEVWSPLGALSQIPVCSCHNRRSRPRAVVKFPGLPRA